MFRGVNGSKVPVHRWEKVEMKTAAAQCRCEKRTSNCLLPETDTAECSEHALIGCMSI